MAIKLKAYELQSMNRFQKPYTRQSKFSSSKAQSLEKGHKNFLDRYLIKKPFDVTDAVNIGSILHIAFHQIVNGIPITFQDFNLKSSAEKFAAEVLVKEAKGLVLNLKFKEIIEELSDGLILKKGYFKFLKDCEFEKTLQTDTDIGIIDMFSEKHKWIVDIKTTGKMNIQIDGEFLFKWSDCEKSLIQIGCYYYLTKEIYKEKFRFSYAIFQSAGDFSLEFIDVQQDFLDTGLKLYLLHRNRYLRMKEKLTKSFKMCPIENDLMKHFDRLEIKRRFYEVIGTSDLLSKDAFISSYKLNDLSIRLGECKK